MDDDVAVGDDLGIGSIDVVGDADSIVVDELVGCSVPDLEAEPGRRIRLVGGPTTAVESVVDSVVTRIQSVPAGLKLPLLLAPLMSSVLIA